MIDKTKAIGFLLAAFGGFVALTALLLLIKTQPALPKLESTRLPRLFVIQSGSMSPALTPASLALVFPTPLQKRLLSPLASTPNYFPGDIISYRTGRQVITHRVISVNDSTLPVTYQTQGDANAAPDPNPVSEGQILGRTVFAIPYLGYLAGFAQKPSGFIFLVIVPATIIIYEELRSIKKLLPLPQANPKTALFIPLLGTALIFTAFSGAFFSNREASSGNSFQAAAVFATPTPTPQQTNHLVISEIQIQGGNANQDFVELYNPTIAAIQLNNWQIRHRTSGTSEGSLVAIGVGKSIPAYGFFLWANSQNGYNTQIGADVSNSNNISPNNSLLLRDPDGLTVDQVAWGIGHSNPYSEGTIYPNNPSPGQSIERKAYSGSSTTSMAAAGQDSDKGNGYDSNNNANDFIPRLLPLPQNSTSPIEIP